MVGPELVECLIYSNGPELYRSSIIFPVGFALPRVSIRMIQWLDGAKHWKSFDKLKKSANLQLTRLTNNCLQVTFLHA